MYNTDIFDNVPDDFFEKVFINILMSDEWLEKIKIKQHFRRRESLKLYKIFRFHLIFKQNVASYATKIVSKRLMQNGELNSTDFKKELTLEVKNLLDKIYIRERIVRYNTKFWKEYSEFDSMESTFGEKAKNFEESIGV